MTIGFVHPHKAFLPEIEAYTRFFSSYGIRCEVLQQEGLAALRPEVEWFFMGMDRSPRRAGAIRVHEYASASLPPLRRVKDRVKRQFNTRPDFRLFLNTYVQEQLGFTDGVLSGFRDMGIDPLLFKDTFRYTPPQYDCIYCGSVSRDIRLDRVLDRFLPGQPMATRTILVLSRDYKALQKKYGAFPNIVFEGPVPHEQIAHRIRSARFGISYKPFVEPHAWQTVTKLLEYAACGIPVVTSDLPWVRWFQQQAGGRFFYLADDLSNLRPEALEQFHFSFPDLTEWSWEKQIGRSGVVEFLRLKFPEVK